MKSDVFTVGAVDNIDHNPTSQNAMGSFHGTAISIIQFPTQDKPGINRDPVLITTDVAKKKASLLPVEYSEVAPAGLPQTDLYAPVVAGQVKAESSVMSASREKEDGWLSAMLELVSNKTELDTKDFVSWAAYHANR